ncbi:Upf1 [Symbiodinium sp. CCMP2592]|nr:Upf1 [Symbiodinium sp. CCMP2592]
MFRDERECVVEDDSALLSEDEDDEDRAGPPPSSVVLQRCRYKPELNGRYVLSLELSAPGRPVYQKEAFKEQDPDSDLELVQVDGQKHVAHYREKASGGLEPGWVISNGLKGKCLMINAREARSPPCLGWKAIDDDGTLLDDTGGFFQKQVGFSQRPGRQNQAQQMQQTPPAEGVPTSSEPAAPRAVDAKSARKSLQRLDLTQLRGHVRCPDPCVAEYFGHFVVLAHLEHLADISSIKRRRERSSADQLVRWGYALNGMKILSVFGRKEAGGKNRILPGWEDVGVEMAAMQLPMGGVDMERMRLRRGDSVTISLTDPLKDRLAEGTINDIRPGTLIVQIRGNFPEDCQKKFWRVDKSANATVYERQMWALLCLNHAAKVQPTVELMTAAPVGLADRWALRWQRAPPEAPKKGQKQRKSRSRSAPKRKRRKARSPSSSEAKGKAEAEESDSSEQRQKIKRKKRCVELANGEIVEDHREDRLLQAKKQVGEEEEMNESQRKALKAALSQTCTVIQGPPGTGKTSVSVQILHFWTKILGMTPVLATSDSNVAVDNICEGLRSRGVKAVRVGRPEKVRSVIEDMTLEAEVKRLKEQESADRSGKGDADGNSEATGQRSLPGGKGKAGGKFGGKSGMKGGEDFGEAAARHFEDRRAQNRQDFELQMKILREADVICTTTIAAGMDFLARLSSFEGILVDEVAQATELSTSVPVILRGANRLVLVGDHCQLPPAVISPEAEVRGLSVSVYSRLVQAGGLQPFLLDTQYRSHHKLAEFSSKAFYDGLLKSGIEDDKRTAPQGVPWPNSKCPIAFVNVDAQEELEGDSKANTVEAQMVASLVGKVLGYGELSVSQVGVVTPYVAQVRRLRQFLRPVPASDSILDGCFHRGLIHVCWSQLTELLSSHGMLGRQGYCSGSLADSAIGMETRVKSPSKQYGMEETFPATEALPGIRCASVDNFQGREKEIRALPSPERSLTSELFRARSSDGFSQRLGRRSYAKGKPIHVLGCDQATPVRLSTVDAGDIDSTRASLADAGVSAVIQEQRRHWSAWRWTCGDATHGGDPELAVLAPGIAVWNC